MKSQKLWKYWKEKAKPANGSRKERKAASLASGIMCGMANGQLSLGGLNEEKSEERKEAKASDQWKLICVWKYIIRLNIKANIICNIMP